ncbi:MAG TPA: TatD family hydrolase [Bacteroidia bacterium]|nr:TatD family hydrolase [Bacteroidia bacterium]
MFINTHTHAQIYDAQVELVNLDPSHSEKTKLYSYGIHPWKIDPSDRDYQIQRLRQVASEKRCLAIGECGLDKLCQVDMQIQADVFIEHIHLANAIQKPLIVHCVKAFNELINCLNLNDNKVPVIIHGFNNNENIARMLQNEGCSFSFGKALLAYDSNASRVIRSLGRKQIFLETDDSDISIKYIYRKAAELLGIGEDILQEQIRLNFETIFHFQP